MQYVEYETHDRIAFVRLNRPERLNAIGRQIAQDIFEAWQLFAKDDSARVAILTGNGRAFCAGRDIKEHQANFDQGNTEMGIISLAQNKPPLRLVPDIDKPIIAAVNGAAYGLGLAMVTWCDFRIAADTARFGAGGLSTGVLGPWVITIQQNLHWSAALELFLFCEEIDAQRAYEMGLVNRVVPAAEVMPLAIQYAERILSFPPRQTQLLIQVMHNARPDPPRAVWEQYWAAHREMQKLADMEVATRAWVARQRPQYRGA